MIDAELLAEVRTWIDTYGLTKWEIFIGAVTVGIFLRLPIILKCFTEMRAIDRNYQHKARILEAKVDREEQKRLEKSGRIEK